MAVASLVYGTLKLTVFLKNEWIFEEWTEWRGITDILHVDTDSQKLKAANQKCFSWAWYSKIDCIYLKNEQMK